MLSDFVEGDRMDPSGVDTQQAISRISIQLSIIEVKFWSFSMATITVVLLELCYNEVFIGLVAVNQGMAAQIAYKYMKWWAAPHSPVVCSLAQYGAI